MGCNRTHLLNEAWPLLKDNGVLLLDTPARDAFYHQLGALSYRMTLGRNPSFLSIMYSNAKFGHKQIFSSAQLTSVLELCGFEIVSLKKIHELSFPYHYCLKKLLKFDILARVLAPAVSLFFRLFRINNKVVIVARKKTEN